MITFSIAILLLVLGYELYGRFVERAFRPDYSRTTPAVAHPDGVDFMLLPTWKIFMIQFLNIAGLGPIFGAIMGAKFGTASYLWIVFGTIFAGATHDYLAGMVSLRNDGESLPQIIGRYLGERTKRVFGIITMVLMVLVGAVFVSGPAELLAGMTPDYLDAMVWIVIIFAYYVLATLLPIDKIIGRVYPLFAIALIFMAVGILVSLYVVRPDLPEMWESFGTKWEPAAIFPMMFISIACGAISGFHATQSPLMARCMRSERHGRPIFYGAMVTEGLVALVWAAAATCFFGEHGITFTAADGKVMAYSGAKVATLISNEWLGTLGGVLALLGIVAAPITSGDTALRSARLIVADYLGIEQRSVAKRLLVSLPLFLITIGVLVYSINDANGFNVIWRYFAWSNQALSVFTLWSLTVFFASTGRKYLITLVPAMFMTAVCVSYLFVAPECLGLFRDEPLLGGMVGIAAAAISLTMFVLWYRKNAKR